MPASLPHPEMDLSSLGLYQRAELLDQILNLVRASNLGSPTQKTDRPALAILNNKVFFQGRSLDLTTKPMSLKLFKIFAKSQDRWLSRENVIKEIYDIKVDSEVSQRRLESMNCNAVKLISRTRLLANEHLGADGLSKWFVRDQAGWSLVQQVQ